MKKQLLFIMTIALFIQGNIMAQDSEYVLFFDAATENQSIKYSDDATTSAMDGATDYTIEMWVYPNSNSAIGDVWLTMRNMFRLTYFTNNRFYFTHKDYSTGSVVNTFYNVTDNAITLDEWNHIAVICNSSDGANGSIKLFVNGVDVTVQSYDAKALVGGDANNDIFVSYGGGDYSNMYAREVRVKKTAETIGNLNTAITDSNYVTDADTTVLFHFAEGTGLTTVNSASGVDANFGYSGAHYPTWVTFASTLSFSDNNTTDFSIFPNPVNSEFFTIQARNNETIQEVELVDVLGKSVKSIAFNTAVNSENINIDKLNAGIYIVKIKTDAGIGTQKIVIE